MHPIGPDIQQLYMFLFNIKSLDFFHAIKYLDKMTDGHTIFFYMAIITHSTKIHYWAIKFVTLILSIKLQEASLYLNINLCEFPL